MTWNPVKQLELNQLLKEAQALEAEREKQVAVVRRILGELQIARQSPAPSAPPPWGAAVDHTDLAARALVAHAPAVIDALTPFVPLAPPWALPEVRV